MRQKILSKLIFKSAKMIEIGRTLPFPFQMTCIDSKVRDVIPIPGILADFEINLGEEFWRIAI